MEKSEAALAAAKEKLEWVAKVAAERKKRLQDAENQVMAKLSAMENQYRLEVAATNASMRAELKIDDLRRDAVAARIDAQNAKADMIEADPFIPLGARYRHFKYSGGGFSKKLQPDGTFGVLQVYRPGDPWPANLSYTPEGGDLVIRAIKKDGSFSINGETVGQSIYTGKPIDWARPRNNWERCDEQ